MRIGILGAGQLGRMLALSGYPLDTTFSLYDTSGSPTAGIGNIISNKEGSHEKLNQFLEEVDLVTYEFENIPLSLTQEVEKKLPLYPSSESIRVCQNRIEEKSLFTALGIPTANYRVATSAEELKNAAEELGCPVVAKSVTDGYDGKGQAVLQKPDDAPSAWEAINHPTLIVESFVKFEREVSIIAVRARDGELAFYPLSENIHRDGILRYSIAPAPSLSQETQSQAEAFIKDLLNELDHVGVLTLELFETEKGLLANEMAPRVHNSGHWSMEGAACSQFENHIRAISGLPLGSTQATQLSCMINIIGESGNPQDLLKLPYVNLHLYGKEERAGRKIGHINILADSYKELVLRVENTVQFIPSCPEFESSLNTTRPPESENELD